MIDDYLRNIEPANCIGERAQPLHVSDVDDNQEIDPLQRGRPLSRSIIYIRAQKKAKRLGPRRRIHDLYGHSARFEQPGERGLRSAAVAVGVDVGGDCNRAPRAELPREALYRFNSVWRYR